MIHKHNAYEKDIEHQSREFTEKFRTQLVYSLKPCLSDINTMSVNFVLTLSSFKWAINKYLVNTNPWNAR